METSRRSFLKALGLFTAGLAVMPQEPIRRLWALSAVEQTASGISVFKATCWIQVSNELLRDCAPMAEQLIHRNAQRWLGTDRFSLRQVEGGEVYGSTRFIAEVAA